MLLCQGTQHLNTNHLNPQINLQVSDLGLVDWFWLFFCHVLILLGLVSLTCSVTLYDSVVSHPTFRLYLSHRRAQPLRNSNRPHFVGQSASSHSAAAAAVTSIITRVRPSVRPLPFRLLSSRCSKGRSRVSIFSSGATLPPRMP